MHRVWARGMKQTDRQTKHIHTYFIRANQSKHIKYVHIRTVKTNSGAMAKGREEPLTRSQVYSIHLLNTNMQLVIQI